MYPNIVERLRGTPARVEELTRAVGQASLTTNLDGAWSILENVGHLWDLEHLWFGRVVDFEQGETILRAADLENRQTHESDYNSAKLEDVLHKFRTDRMKMINKLTNAPDTFPGATSIHPRLEQPMRVIDLAFFVAEHDDHHLASISELLRRSL